MIVFSLDQTQLDVIELNLCEQEHLILKPDQLYLFLAAPDCPDCQRLKEIYYEHSKPQTPPQPK